MTVASFSCLILDQWNSVENKLMLNDLVICTHSVYMLYKKLME